MDTDAKTPVSLTDEQISRLTRVFSQVWCEIGGDVEACCRSSREKLTNGIAIEACIDAGRLTTIGGREVEESDSLLDELIAKHGYDAVFDALVAQVRLE